jgi:hypothetical protein
MAWYHWLTDNGLWRSVIGTAVGFVFGIIVALRPFRKLHRSLFHIADQLDTTTPGGLTDILHALKPDPDDSAADGSDGAGNGDDHMPPGREPFREPGAHLVIRPAPGHLAPPRR